MNSLMNTNNNIVRMSSRDIADLVESGHDDVKRSIERPAERVQYNFRQWRMLKITLISRSLCTWSVSATVTLLSLNCPLNLPPVSLTAGRNLKRPVIPVIPQSFSDALRLAADLEEEKQRLALELASAAPKWNLSTVIALRMVLSLFGRWQSY